MPGRVDAASTAERLQVLMLMLMGHGDESVVRDVNHPSSTIAKETASGCDMPRATTAIMSLMPPHG